MSRILLFAASAYMAVVLSGGVTHVFNRAMRPVQNALNNTAVESVKDCRATGTCFSR